MQLSQIYCAKSRAAILQSFSMGCLGCAIANNETIREAAMVHGIPLDGLAAKPGF